MRKVFGVAKLSVGMILSKGESTYYVQDVGETTLKTRNGEDVLVQSITLMNAYGTVLYTNGTGMDGHHYRVVGYLNPTGLAQLKAAKVASTIDLQKHHVLYGYTCVFSPSLCDAEDRMWKIGEGESSITDEVMEALVEALYTND